MQVCPECGHDNPDGVTFCGNRDCNAVLSWNRPGPPPSPGDDTATERDFFVAVPPSQSTPTAEGEDSCAVTASLDVDRVEVAPGEQGSCHLQVHNRGSVVDQFALEVSGPAAGWASLDSDTINLYPDADGNVTLQFAPPRRPDVTAGPTAFEVRITSTQDPTVHMTVPGIAVVGAHHRVDGELAPATAEATRMADYQVRVTNRGNTPERVALTARDPDQRLDLHLEPPEITCEPGSTAAATVTARAPKLVLRKGGSDQHSFTVTARRSDHVDPVFEDRATLEQTPLLGGWVPRLLVLAVVVLGILGAILLFGGDGGSDGGRVTVPDLAGQTAEQAAATLEQAGLVLGDTVSQQAPDQSPGTVIAQDPGADEVVDESTEVDIAVAVGERPVVVPEVIDQSLDQARATLAEAGLTVGDVVDEPSQVEPGVVVNQDPPPGTELAAGAVVDLLVSVDDAGQPTPTPPPDDLPDLAVQLDSCGLVPGGGVRGGDALTIFIRVPNLQPRFPVEQGVRVTITSDVGLTGTGIGSTTEGNEVRPAQLELLADDYGGPVDLVLTVDPDDEIAEADEGNNAITVRVGLPATQPDETIDPLPCRQAG